MMIAKSAKRHSTLRRLPLLAVAVGCGSNLSMGGGIAGTSSVSGPISGFGSIIVGGVEFDTGSATVTIEGNPADVADLRLGMVALVRGTIEPRRAAGVAETVRVDHLARGPLALVDPGAARLSLLGQEIVADASTVFEPVPFAELAPGDRVAVSGFLGGDGRIRATRIAAPEDGEIELTGLVADLDPAALTFRIGGLVVQFAGAVVEGAPSGGLVDELLVEVEAEVPPANDVLTAVGVEVFDSSLAEEGDGLDVEGFVTRVPSPDELVLNETQPVRLTAETRFEGGDRADLVVGARVDVEGVAGEGGLLIAREVEFLR
ncbi:MAG: hypothetical protein FJ144_09635 [Deltaproteobacteria bacterium]|nr:hypothetical protein [Deltaproteobacteria bacterium]